MVENSYRRENPPGRQPVDWEGLKCCSSKDEYTQNVKCSLEISVLKGTGGGSGVRRLILKACY